MNKCHYCGRYFCYKPSRLINRLPKTEIAKDADGEEYVIGTRHKSVALLCDSCTIRAIEAMARMEEWFR